MEKKDPNLDITVSPHQGTWLISVYSYTGPEAAAMSRKMVMELRHNPAYKLPAYVFNRTGEERRKEMERVKQILDKQREMMQKENIPADTQMEKTYVRYFPIQDQYAVLVGGYPDQESAQKALAQMRKLTPPDPSKVDLDKKLYKFLDEEEINKTFQANPLSAAASFFSDLSNRKSKKNESCYVNPFERAFIVPNPTLKMPPLPEYDPKDLAFFKKLNAQETYSLFHCPGAVTLAIKEFCMPSYIMPKDHPDEPRSKFPTPFLKKWTGMKKQEDAAAFNAHSLAEHLRSHLKLEAYVLHARYSSVVTVGSFASLDDPALKSMQQLLPNHLRAHHDAVHLFPTPLPMRVPGR